MSKINGISYSNRRKDLINQKNIKKRKYNDDDVNNSSDLNHNKLFNIEEYPYSLYNISPKNINKYKDETYKHVNNTSEDVICTFDMLIQKYRELMNKEFQQNNKNENQLSIESDVNLKNDMNNNNNDDIQLLQYNNKTFKDIILSLDSNTKSQILNELSLWIDKTDSIKKEIQLKKIEMTNLAYVQSYKLRSQLGTKMEKMKNEMIKELSDYKDEMKKRIEIMKKDMMNRL